MNNEHLIHDTGGSELWVRLLMTPFALLALVCAFLIGRAAPLPSLLCALLGLYLLSIWCWRTRLFYDPDRHEIVFRGSTAFWIPRRLPLAGAAAVYLRDVRIRGRISGIGLGIRYQDGRESWLTRVAPGDSKRLVTVFSNATTLPIAP